MSATRPSIVFLCPGFPSDESDTSCLPAIQNYVRAYADLHPDVDVHVVAFQYPFRRDDYRWFGVQVRALGGRNRPGPMRMPTWIRAGAAIGAIAEQGPIEVLHAFWMTECALVGARASKRHSVPLVVSIAGQDARTDNPYLKYLNLESAYVTAGSRFAAGEFSQHARRPVDRVVPLGLDTERLPAPDASVKRDIDLIGVGALTPLKDYTRFVEIVHRLRPDFPNLRACIVGGGPQRDALQAQIDQLGLHDALILAGELPRHEVIERMHRSRIFLHTSQYEGQGYVFLEALHAGLPVVCHDVGFTNGTNRVVRCESPEEISTAIARLLREPLPYESTTLVSVEQTVRDFDSIYAELAKAHASG